MESTISNAFLLLGIGMITVFVVLLLVVLSGSLLIKLINKYAPAPVANQKLKVPAISNKDMAILTAVVHQVTNGKGQIDSVEKM